MPAHETPKLGSLPPSRSARSKCWTARDAYFACLDSHNLWLQGLGPRTHEEIIAVDPQQLVVSSETDKSLTKEERQRLFACRVMKEMFDRECLPSWVNHFGLLRVKDLQTEYLKKKVDKDERERETSDDAFWEKVSAKPGQK
ncbi:hypothetical protein SpCBS45565_g02499 [Spizellomyces sp. 'palustris']|nr:hypothetical protein SpCBS45565_g02499 [Spizellomyces sp. 'palustris']